MMPSQGKKNLFTFIESKKFSFRSKKISTGLCLYIYVTRLREKASLD